MSFEEDLRRVVQRAGSSMPEAPLAYSETFRRAKRSRTLHRAVLAVAAAAVVAMGAVSVNALVPSQESLPPVGPGPVLSPPPACSAANEEIRPEQAPWLTANPPPQPVLRMWARIDAAARACDYQKLENLALEGSKGFTFSYGALPGASPAEHWKQVEEAQPKNRRPVLRTLVRLLGGRYGTQKQRATPGGPLLTAYVWPRISLLERPTEADWDELAATDAYSRRQIARMKKSYEEFGIGYLDYRLAITRERRLDLLRRRGLTRNNLALGLAYSYRNDRER